MSRSNESDGDEPIVQRHVSAASAGPVETRAPNSVFALGSQPTAAQSSVAAEAPQSKPASKRPTKPNRRTTGEEAPGRLVLKVIESCGPLDATQIAKATGLESKKAAKVADYLSGKNGGGRLVRDTGPSGKRIYRLPNQAGLTRFLAKRASKERPAGAGTALAVADSQVLDEPPVFGVLSTGERLIELPYLKARLKLGHWMELRDYLSGVQLPASR